ncbi:MAG: mechanosensitive ion channel family protein [Spirochaetaceae bacterium]|jgi:miniconductance mechanosensitive channel|nr:mechanosensitive ion channel family protein [Spirochaetaceae bacterium]
MNNYLYDLLKPIYHNAEFSPKQEAVVDFIIALAALVLIALALGKLSGFLFRKFLPHFFGKSKNIWAAAMESSGFLRFASRIVPAIAILFLIPVVLQEGKGFTLFAQRLAAAFVIGMSARIIALFLDTLQFIYQKNMEEYARRRPIKSYLQLVKIFLYIITIILMVTTMLNVSPKGFLGGIGALSAVLMLVFKDSITGFVSSLQLSLNDMIRIGDVIDMSKYGAEGTVIDVTLQSVVVRNWDMTTSTIPIYNMVSDSFRNLRVISEEGCRRVKQAMYIDLQSVKFLSPAKVDEISRLPLLQMQPEAWKNMLENAPVGSDSGIPAAGGAVFLTNLGLFRMYTELYLKNHPMVAKDRPIIVRHLPQESHGLPLQLWFYCAGFVWESYEHIMASIFEHLFAVMREFDLRVCQFPTGADFRSIKLNGAG